jgi:uncharacterized protein (TIGR02266 family)
MTSLSAPADPSKDFTYLMEQVKRARESLGQALGLVQDIKDTELNIEDLTRMLAESVRALFDGEQEKLADSQYIGKAMDNLRSILSLMQDSKISNDNLNEAVATVAQILAILFPVYKALPEKQPCQTTRDSVVPDISSFKTGDFKSNDERRKAPRISLEVDIGGYSDSNFFTGFSMDISEGGLFVATYDIPPLGTKVNLNFKIPGGPVLCIDGIVKWIREYNDRNHEMIPGAGISFTKLSKKDAHIINDYMTHNNPLFYDEE